MKLAQLTSLALGLGLSLTASAEILPQPQQLGPHSYAWVGPYGPPTRENQGFQMNLGFVVGEESVAVIDSGYSDDMARAMLGQVRRITDRAVRYVINTNSQPHRILGNRVFRGQGAEILAAEEAVPRMTAEGAAMAATAEGVLGLSPGSLQGPGPPARTIQAATRLDLGGVTLDVVPVGTAHTAGSLVVRVVEDRLVYAGDVLYGGRLLAVLPVSRVDGWIAAFDGLRADADAVFVPGHGVPGRLAEFEHPTYRYLSTLKAHMDRAVEEGTELGAAIASLDQGPWRHLADFDALAGRNAHQVYLEREAMAFE